MLLGTSLASARDMSAKEMKCLGQIRDETDFIVSRINLIHRDYEKQVKQSALGKYKSGNYSTHELLDNTIRKYHRKLLHKIKRYPFHYEARVKATPRSKSQPCLAEQLRDESIGMIHHFEVSWEKTLRQAQENAHFFRQVDSQQ